ncbi:uncharacterized protein TRIVIDRAFT_160746, partial [Trichoderma virens Gv29-8]
MHATYPPTLSTIYPQSTILTVYPGTPLHAACSIGSTKIVQMLLKNSAPLFVFNVKMQTPLQVALEAKQFHIAKLLINALKTTPSPSSEFFPGRKLLDYNVSSYLHLACSANKLAIVTALLEHGANPNTVNQDGRSAVSYAMEYGYLEIFTQLLNYGA